MILAEPIRSALACPRCCAPLEQQLDALRCSACGRRFPVVDGLCDFGPDEAQPGMAQRFMESRLVTRVYEDRFRPLMTTLVSPLDYAREEAYLRKWFRPVAGAVLDLGCGTGRYARLLAELSGAQRVVGLDLSRAMLRAASRRSETLAFVRGSAMGLPFAGASIGAVNCTMALHLFPDAERAIGEVGRVLGSGGSFTCATVVHSGIPAFEPIEDALGRVGAVRFFDEVELIRSLEGAGLRVQDVTRARNVVLVAARRAERG